MNTPPAKEGGVAAFKVEGDATAADAGAGLGVARHAPRRAGDHRQRHGLRATAAARRRSSRGPTSACSSIRQSAPRKGTHATIYVLDAITGKELWTSGEQMKGWNHFSGITVVNGRVYLGTYEGTLYCFGVQ